ncbi:hypothetical protein FOA43_002134 [Brettanomyces nanus]|uniref:Endoplasmic reticulum lectin n=1 Tax=Eeniella nana TaxID=13502 RepID=A0A875S1H1_EENNA|nr:uncharacterized protein FOA43_002134 [Brettanomyces nanus]QPG74798.1 hypothetical protein FOA43_002134 [Brettanomyces nanus]
MLFITLLASIVAASTFEEYPPDYKVTLGSDWINKDDVHPYLYTIRDDNFQYACNISTPSYFKDVNLSRSINTTHLDLQKKDAIQAIKNFNKVHENHCIYSELGYWSYRACFSRGFTQFHYTGDRSKVHEQLQTDPSIPSHRLGYMKDDLFSKLSDFEFVKSSDGSRYLSQLVYNGSVCDLTGKERSVFVQYRCAPEYSVPVITDVDELKTCQYRMVISSAELCQYPVLKPQNYVTEANISCNPIRESNSNSDAHLLAIHEKLDLSTLDLQPIGDGIFLGSFQNQALPMLPRILVTNRKYSSLENDFLTDVGQAFMNMMKANRVFTPPGVSPARPLKKGDKFEYVTEVYGLNREFIANVAIEQNENDFLVTYFTDFGSANDNFVEFTAGDTTA